MARIASGETVQIEPTNNIYTVLAAVASLAVLIGLIVLFVRASALGVNTKPARKRRNLRRVIMRAGDGDARPFCGPIAAEFGCACAAFHEISLIFLTIAEQPELRGIACRFSQAEMFESV